MGNTATHRAGAAPHPVHPHVRGEHRYPRRGSTSKRGSSPRAWGTPGLVIRDEVNRRFIPTCVGNTATGPPDPPAGAVHPHVRGEHLDGRHLSGRAGGSSPRAWGTHPVLVDRRLDGRFIPTCVGNTLWRVQRIRGHAVHPHVRGEHASLPRSPKPSSGSSPRAWGTLGEAGDWDLTPRFIPTCVGNTTPKRGQKLPITVHPHVRGEHL